MGPILAFVIIGCVGLVLYAFLASWQRGLNANYAVRGEEIARLADHLGWTCSTKNRIARFRSLTVLRFTLEQVTKHYCSGAYHGHTSHLFDLDYRNLFNFRRYVIPRYTRSVIVIEADLPLTPLVIRPVRIHDRIVKLLGLNRVDLGSPEFHRAYYVKCKQTARAADLINRKVMAYLLSAPRFSVEFDAKRVFVYGGVDYLFTPQEFLNALEVASGVIDRLSVRPPHWP